MKLGRLYFPVYVLYVGTSDTWILFFGCLRTRHQNLSHTFCEKVLFRSRTTPKHVSIHAVVASKASHKMDKEESNIYNKNNTSSSNSGNNDNNSDKNNDKNNDMNEKTMRFDLDPQLVHRILMTDPHDFESLMMMTQDDNEQTTNFSIVAFEEFQEKVINNNSRSTNGTGTSNNERSGASDGPQFVMKRAYHDHLMKKVEEIDDLTPVFQLLLELHTSIRALVPNRSDLHSILNDKREVPFTEEVVEVLPWIIEAGEALCHLESEASSETTRDWISKAKEKIGDNSMSNIGKITSFVIVSILYLLDKAEHCDKEKKQFYVSHVLAPKLLTSGEGFSIERKRLHERFGSNPPITAAWISSLIKDESEFADTEEDELRANSMARRHLLQKGWIHTILFQKDRQTTVPEIFFLDVSSLSSIRSTTRTAAAGSALALHACRAAKRNPDVLLHDETNGAPLLDVLKHPRVSSVKEYEETVGDMVISLAQEWNDGPLEPEEVELLRGQTTSVLRGEDAVMKLLDDRMRKLFVELATDGVDDKNDNNNNNNTSSSSTSTSNSGGNIPTTMKSGLLSTSSMSTDRSNDKQPSSFVSRARSKFQERGMAFFALDLAHAAELAYKVANLAYDLYATDFLDTMILDALD